MRELAPVHEAWLPNEHSLYRPRHAERQHSSLVAASIFFLTPLMLLVLGVRPASFENRALAEFPSISSGWGMFTGLSAWATDHLPLRDTAVAVEDAISRGVFGEAPNLGRATGADTPGPVPGTGFGGTNDNERRSSAYPTVIEGKDGWLFLGNDVEGACLPSVPRHDVVARLNRLRKVVEESGRDFILVVPPNKTMMMPQFLPGEYVGKGCAADARKQFWAETVPQVKAIDLRSTLERAAADAGTPVYTPLDTHWTPGGALVMVRVLAEKIEPKVTENWRITPGDLLTASGDLPPLIGRKAETTVRHYNLAPDGRTVLSRPIRKQFIQPLELTQPARTGVVRAKVGMIADSFTLAATPYLSGGFADVTLIHADTVGKSQRDLGRLFAERDVIVLEAVERTLVSGRHPLLEDKVIDGIEQELKAHPR